MHCLYLSYFFSFFQSITVSLSLLDFRDLDTFEDYRVVILWGVCQFGFVYCFLMIRFRLYIFDRNITEVMLCSRLITSGEHFGSLN